MSGGHFCFCNGDMKEIASEITSIVTANEYDFSRETLAKLLVAADYIEKAGVMIERVDYLLCSDDSEETFHERWKEEIDAIKIKLPEIL